MSTEKYKTSRGTRSKKAQNQRKQFRRKSRGLSVGVKAAAFIVVAVIALGVIFFLNNGNSSTASTGKAGNYPYEVAQPGRGEQAPPIRLSSTDGSTFDLASQRGKTVLLFFQEGLSCQPCWDQIKDMESNMKQFQALGIDRVMSITTDPLDALKQKVADEGITTPVLSDENFSVSQAYHANQYGMMDGSRDGHTFIVVGADGRIRWRADYGGAPNYTMYVPVPSLIADLQEGLNGRST